MQRLRKADGDERRQLRGFVFAVAAAAAVMVTGLLVWRSPLPGVLTVTPALELGSLRQRIEDDEELDSRARRAREQLLEATSELREPVRACTRPCSRKTGWSRRCAP